MEYFLKLLGFVRFCADSLVPLFDKHPAGALLFILLVLVLGAIVIGLVALVH